LQNLLASEPSLASPAWVLPYLRGRMELGKGNYQTAIPLLRNAAFSCLAKGYFLFPGTYLADALRLAGEVEQSKFWLRKVMNSQIYNPFEYFRAKQSLEHFDLHGKD